jgi:hypothetical protein
MMIPAPASEHITNFQFYFPMKYFSGILILLCLGCLSKPKAVIVKVSLIDNKESVKIAGLDNEIVADIGRDSIAGAWQNLFPVYRLPADTDMKDFQRPQPGNYHLSGSAVIFTPDTPFINGQTYFLRCYQFGKGKSTWDMIKGKQKLGSQAYTDLTFKK